MRYFTSPAMHSLCALLGGTTLLLAAAGFGAGMTTGWFVLGAAVLLDLVCIGHTLWRHRQIDALADYLRRITAGEYALDVRDHCEGELSLLKSELYKVTVLLSEANEKLQAEKLQLAESIADISHQLKTPLTSMLMMTDLLGEEDLPADKREEFTRHIRIQLERIQWLVSSLLKMSRLDAGVVAMHKEQIPVRTLIQEAIAPLLIPMELKDQTLSLEGEDSARLVCDRQWSAEALLNVVKNCVEHTPAGGKITIRWQGNPLYTVIDIEDNGTGIAPEDLPHIFTRFYRGKHEEGATGVGIGLSMAKSILARQDAQISAASTPGKGTTFTVRFAHAVV